MHKFLSMNYFNLVLAIFFVFLPENLNTFTEKAEVFLQSYVKSGLVNYAEVKENFNQIDQLYQQIGKVSLKDASEQEKKAFYINAYNIIVIHQIAEHYPVHSPMDIEGFFDKKEHLIAGEKLTLNALEKERLLKPYQDPRIHFVLVCAARSCPPLADFAYQAHQLDEQLDQKTRQTINNPQFISIMHSKNQVAVSPIFEWYKSDFTGNNQSIIGFINQYRKEKIPVDYSVTFYEYDWTLNDL